MSVQSIINEAVLTGLDLFAREFRTAKPFRHVVIDDFLARPLAEALLQQFPAFEAGQTRNESGAVGNKSTVDKIRSLGPAYAELDNAIRSRDFLHTIERITGIESLLYDPWYFGGGTHCNRAGQDLDPHVDFNRHPVRRWHRRLNLIVYLNHDWEDAWGGSLELHSDPRSEHNRVKQITPLFNRCVIFETTEHSWHGFARIQPPADRHDALRRSIALYFYSEDRPEEELADTHSTIYVDRPLPGHITAGHTLSKDDAQALRDLLARRDQHNQRLYRETRQLQARLDQAERALTRGTLGRIKYVVDRIRTRLGK